MLYIDHLSKTYRDGTRALSDVELTIEQGEIITLVGPSGCGKSTLLRLIAGLDRPTSGRIIRQGQDITALSAERRDMGVVFQNYALFPHLTVAQNIAFGLRVRGVARAERERKAAAIMERLQLSRLAARRPIQLSGGQQQRVALGRALVIEPSILLLDEPLTALDAQLREALRLELRQVLDQFGITSVYVTHDQAEALSLGDRVVVLNAGKIEQIGEPRAIYQQPATDFVATFIGTTNRIRGTLCHDTNTAYAVTELGRLMLTAAPVLDGAEGRPLTLLLRPEDLVLATGDQAQFCGTIAQLQFLGDRLRLFVAIPDLPEHMIVDVDPHTCLATGEHVGLRVLRTTPLLDHPS